MPVTKCFLGDEHGEVVVRHTPMLWGNGAIIFLHGLGDSRQCFLEAFECKGLENYNLIAPDLPGSGNSPGGDELSITGLIHCVSKIIEVFKVPEYILVGHGLGADIATWLCQRSSQERNIKGIINIEGTIGEENLKFADMAIKTASNQNRTFYKWFRDDFSEKYILLEHIQKWQSYRRYSESLTLTKPRAFLRISKEMRNNLYTNEFSKEIQAYKAFKELNIPKYYCYGEHGFSKPNAEILNIDNIPHLYFSQSSHWLMIDEALQFYPFLTDFCIKHMPQPPPYLRIKNWFMVRFKQWLKTIPGPRNIFDKIKYWIRTKIKY
jgi:pimeloyl-ACP methyl ester carboxylesterase